MPEFLAEGRTHTQGPATEAFNGTPRDARHDRPDEQNVAVRSRRSLQPWRNRWLFQGGYSAEAARRPATGTVDGTPLYTFLLNDCSCGMRRNFTGAAAIATIRPYLHQIFGIRGLPTDRREASKLGSLRSGKHAKARAKSGPPRTRSRQVSRSHYGIGVALFKSNRSA